MSSTFITSAPTLSNHPVAYQPLFSPLPVHDTLYFDEGPRPPNTRDRSDTSLSGSIDTRSTEPYAQGVEITRQGQYDAGLAKIWSGEPGHRLLSTRYGMDKNYFPDPGFAEMDLFSPRDYLLAQESESPLWFNLITFPIVTGDNDQLENFNFNGVIEPLTIRPVVAFFSIETPFESHAVRGSVGGGNINQMGGSDSVVTISSFEPSRETVGYLDMVDMFQNQPMNGFFRHEFSTILPFSDERLIRNNPAVMSEPAEFVEALTTMSGSTDNYVRHNQRSSVCGWYYDNNSKAGTDSLAFGGMTY